MLFIVIVLEQTFCSEEAVHKQTNKLCPTERGAKLCLPILRQFGTTKHIFLLFC